MSIKKEKKDMTDWNNLYDYVKLNILGYNDMNLPKYMVLRLQGLSKGQFMANKSIKPMASYDYKTILFTFKACKQDIMSGLMSNQTKFTNEEHKFNYIMVIIEKNINDIVIRLKNAKNAKEKAETVNMDHIFTNGAEYKTKTKVNEKLNDLW